MKLTRRGSRPKGKKARLASVGYLRKRLVSMTVSITTLESGPRIGEMVRIPSDERFSGMGQS